MINGKLHILENNSLMSSNHKHIIFAVAYILISLLVMAALILPSGNADDEEEPKIGDFLYLDDNKIIHIDENCPSLLDCKGGNGHRKSGKQYLDTLTFSEDELSGKPRYCSECVNTETYLKIQEISDRNSQSDYDISNFSIFENKTKGTKKRAPKKRAIKKRSGYSNYEN